MAMEKVEYSFPHEDEDEKVIEVEPSSAAEIKKAKRFWFLYINFFIYLTNL